MTDTARQIFEVIRGPPQIHRRLDGHPIRLMNEKSQNGGREETMETRTLLTRTVAVVATGCLLAVFAASAARAEDGKALYDKNCVSCHGPAGKGDGPAAKVLKPAPQDFAVALKGKSDADITKITKEGGKAVGKAPTMPAYGPKLSEDQLKAVVEYVKGLAK